MNVEDHPHYGRALSNSWVPAFIFKDHLFVTYQGDTHLYWGIYSPNPSLGFLGRIDDGNGVFRYHLNHFEPDDIPVIQALAQLHR